LCAAQSSSMMFEGLLGLKVVGKGIRRVRRICPESGHSCHVGWNPKSNCRCGRQEELS
jgi:hypothetical protein